RERRLERAEPPARRGGADGPGGARTAAAGVIAAPRGPGAQRKDERERRPGEDGPLVGHGLVASVPARPYDRVAETGALAGETGAGEGAVPDRRLGADLHVGDGAIAGEQAEVDRPLTDAGSE